MPFTVLYEGPLDGLREARPIEDIPDGSPVRVELELRYPVAWVWDVAGAERLAQMLLVRGQGIEVTDVRAEGSRRIVIEGVARGVPWVLVAGLLVGALASIALIVSSVRFGAELPRAVGRGFLGLGLLAVGALGIYALSQRGGRR